MRRAAAFLLVSLLCFFVPQSLAGYKYPANWRLIDVSGYIPVDRYHNLPMKRDEQERREHSYRLRKAYSYGLDSSGGRFNGEYSAFIDYDLRWVPEFMENFDETMEYADMISEVNEAIPDHRYAALVQTIDPGLHRGEIVHISFYIKTQTVDLASIINCDFDWKSIDKTKTIWFGREVSEEYRRYLLCRKAEDNSFYARMIVYVHTKEKLIKYSTTSAPEKGSAGWQRFTSMVSIPEDCVALTIGFSIEGFGKVWADEFVIVEKGGSDTEKSSAHSVMDKPRNLTEKTDNKRGYYRNGDSDMRSEMITQILEGEKNILPGLANEDFEVPATAPNYE